MDFLCLVMYLYVTKSCLVTHWEFEFVTNFLSCKGYDINLLYLTIFKILIFLLHEQTVLLKSVLKFKINNFSKREI